MVSGSGTPNFHSRGVGALVDASFKFFGRDFKTLTIIALICNIPALGLEISSFFLGQDRSLVLVWSLVGIVVNFLASSLLVAALTYVVGERYLGRELGAGAALSRAWACLGRMLSTQILVGLWVTLGFLCLLIPGVIWYFTLALAVPVTVLEGIQGSKALARSKQLVKYDRNKVVGIVFGMLLLASLIGYALGSAWGFCTGLLLQGTTQSVTTVLGARVLGYILSPLYPVALVLLYYDLRISHEAFDLEMLSTNLESP